MDKAGLTDFTQSSEHLNFQLRIRSGSSDYDENEFCVYVNRKYFYQWSTLFKEEVDKYETYTNLECSEILINVQSHIDKSDVIMFLEVISADRNCRNLGDLIRLMRVSCSFKCISLAHAICCVCVIRSRQFKDNPDVRRHELPNIFRILDNLHNVPYLMGLYPAILADASQSDITYAHETIGGSNSDRHLNCDFPNCIIEHLLKQSPGNQRATEIHGQRWDLETMPNLLPSLVSLTGEDEDAFGYDIDLELKDRNVRFSRDTLLSVSSVFRSILHYGIDESPTVPHQSTGDDGKVPHSATSSPVLPSQSDHTDNDDENDQQVVADQHNTRTTLALPEDSSNEWSVKTRLMLSPTVYGCLWRIMGVEELTEKLYLDLSHPTEKLVTYAQVMFRFADRYNISGLVNFYAEVIMRQQNVSLLDKLILADSSFRTEFLEMCCEDVSELSKTLSNPENTLPLAALSHNTMQRLLAQLARHIHQNPSNFASTVRAPGAHNLRGPTPVHMCRRLANYPRGVIVPQTVVRAAGIGQDRRHNPSMHEPDRHEMNGCGRNSLLTGEERRCGLVMKHLELKLRGLALNESNQWKPPRCGGIGRGCRVQSPPPRQPRGHPLVRVHAVPRLGPPNPGEDDDDAAGPSSNNRAVAPALRFLFPNSPLDDGNLQATNGVNVEGMPDRLLIQYDNDSSDDLDED